MTRADYMAAIAWVAANEAHRDHNPQMYAHERLAIEIVKTYTTVAFVADLFGKEIGQVAQDVCAEYARTMKQRQHSVADIRRADTTTRHTQ